MQRLLKAAAARAGQPYSDDSLVISGERGLDVGDKVRVRLESVVIERGFIDVAAL